MYRNFVYCYLLLYLNPNTETASHTAEYTELSAQ